MKIHIQVLLLNFYAELDTGLEMPSTGRSFSFLRSRARSTFLNVKWVAHILCLSQIGNVPVRRIAKILTSNTNSDLRRKLLVCTKSQHQQR